MRSQKLLCGKILSSLFRVFSQSKDAHALHRYGTNQDDSSTQIWFVVDLDSESQGSSIVYLRYQFHYNPKISVYICDG